MQTEADAWLKSYPTYFKTPLGYGVRYELANALFNEARSPRTSKKKASLFARAQDILYNLNESDNDLIGKVAELRSKIARVHLGGQADVSISQLTTFDQCYIRAGIEYDKVQNFARQIEEAKDDAAKKALDKKLQEHFRGVIQALSRALAPGRQANAPLCDRKCPL